MNIENILKRQESKKELTKKEIEYIVNNYTKGKITDEQMTKFLKNVVEYGMSEKETIYLTKAMISTGKPMDLSDIEGIKVDKHSTGGVGDKVSLVVLPIVASLGIPVAKMSGRSLGFTGGTIDKLESIPGFNVNLTKEEFINNIKNINIAISSQTKDLVPADKKIYALRDITNTIESIPLIASSIMSKKISSGADKIVLDIKVGEGALIKTIEDAKILANLMIKIGNENKKETVALLSKMDEPLGYSIGNSLEIREAINTLLNKGEKRFKRLCIEIATQMVSLGKKVSRLKARLLVKKALLTKQAYKKFLELIEKQGGDITKLPTSKYKMEVYSEFDGYITDIKTKEFGEYVMNLGAGRKTKEEKIDFSAGIVFEKKVGAKVRKGDLLLTIHSNIKQVDGVLDLIKIEQRKPLTRNIILGKIK